MERRERKIMRAVDADELIVQFRRAIETFLPNDPRKHMDFVDSLKCHGWEQGLRVIQNAPPIQLESFWIPVTERLPNIGESVLVTFDTEEVCEMKLREIAGVGQYWFNPYDGYTYEFDRVIAWMPLPEHYKGVIISPECEGDCG